MAKAPLEGGAENALARAPAEGAQRCSRFRTPQLAILVIRTMGQGPEPAGVVRGSDEAHVEEAFRTAEGLLGKAVAAGGLKEIRGGARAVGQDVEEPVAGFGEGGLGVGGEVEEVRGQVLRVGRLRGGPFEMGTRGIEGRLIRDRTAAAICTAHRAVARGGDDAEAEGWWQRAVDGLYGKQHAAVAVVQIRGQEQDRTDGGDGRERAAGRLTPARQCDRSGSPIARARRA